jgi:hypothetical protein
MATTVSQALDTRKDGQLRQPETGPPTRLALVKGQTWWDAAQLAGLHAMGISNDVSQADLLIFLHYCQRTQLDPFSRQIYLIGRREKGPDGKWVTRQTIQVGIDGFRIIARRAATELGVTISYEDTVWYDHDGGEHALWLQDTPPAGAKVVVRRGDERFPGLAKFASYAAYRRTENGSELVAMWRTMPDHMIEKCFSSDTEVLTEHGFRLFADVGQSRIAQVTDGGLELVRATPFAQRYDGPMVRCNGQRLNFSVTPDHDMVTTAGKAEARVLLATAEVGRTRWRIPMTAPGRRATGLAGISDDRLRLAGYFMADGHQIRHRLMISVSKPRKIDALEQLGLHDGTEVKKDAGRVSGGSRPIVTQCDKITFRYPASLLEGIVSGRKQISPGLICLLSQAQARVLLDAWALFDGAVNGSGTRRLYTSNPEHVGMIELLAMAAGYTVSVPRKHSSDISARPGFAITLSATRPTAPVMKPWRHRAGVAEEPNHDGWVWCVTVPSHQIVVRRNGFAMVCGQCAEAFALRRAFPMDLAGIYVEEEMPPIPDELRAEPRRRAKATVVPPEPAPEAPLDALKTRLAAFPGFTPEDVAGTLVDHPLESLDALEPDEIEHVLTELGGVGSQEELSALLDETRKAME